MYEAPALTPGLMRSVSLPWEKGKVGGESDSPSPAFPVVRGDGLPLGAVSPAAVSWERSALGRPYFPCQRMERDGRRESDSPSAALSSSEWTGGYGP